MGEGKGETIGHDWAGNGAGAGEAAGGSARSGAGEYDAMSDGVRIAVGDGVLRVTFEKPESLNAVNTDMLRTVEHALRRHETDENVRAVVFSGEGRGFCSGIDLAGHSPGVEPEVLETASEMVDAANAVIAAIRRFPTPVIAVTQGPVAGVGVSLALVCDLVVCADDAYFMLTFTRIGLMPDGGATALVAASIGRARAMRLALLAPRISAAEAAEWGLVSMVVPATELEQAADDVVRQILDGPAVAFKETKFAVNEATLGSLENALRYERAGQARLMRTADLAEGVAAFTEKRAPKFIGR